MELECTFILITSNSFLICQVDRDQRETHESSRRKQNWKVAFMAFMAFLAAFFG